MILGIIPARFQSSRFPGKPLVMINGKSMLQRVYEQAIQSKKLSKVVVATDDERIVAHAATFGAAAILTKESHPSGTDRCFEAAQAYAIKTGQEVNMVVNVQGDEPFIDPSQIDLLCDTLANGASPIATLAIAVDAEDLLLNTGEVKITMNNKGQALYFSRSPIPFLKGIPTGSWHKHFKFYRHVGLYAYQMPTLAMITHLAPSPLEQAESLEQLRWLENGFAIQIGITDHDSHCIDTPEDLEKILRTHRAASA